MKKIIPLICFVLLFSAACTTRRRTTKIFYKQTAASTAAGKSAQDDMLSDDAPPPQKAVESATKTIVVGKNPSPEEVAAFQQFVEKQYRHVTASEPEESRNGFVYSYSPAGVINPFSEVEIKCIASENSPEESSGQLCEKFFGLITPSYKLKQ